MHWRRRAWFDACGNHNALYHLQKLTSAGQDARFILDTCPNKHHLLKMPEVPEVSEVCILAGADKLGLMGKVLLENY